MSKWHWTDEEDAQVRQLHQQGMVAKQIAGEIDRTVLAIEARLRVLGLPPHIWTQDQDEFLIEKWQQGIKPTMIGRDLGLSGRSVVERANLLGLIKASDRLPPKPRQAKPEAIQPDLEPEPVRPVKGLAILWLKAMINVARRAA